MYTFLRNSMIVLFVLCIFRDARAQSEAYRAISELNNNSEQSLKNAQDLFNNGEYDSCIAVLNQSLATIIFNKKGKEDLLYLKTNAYLEKDDLVNASITMKELLRHNPHYDLIEAENTEDYNRLVKQFEVHPLITLGVRNTLLFPVMQTTHVFPTTNGIDYSVPNRIAKDFLMYYGWAEYQFRENFSVNCEAVLWTMNYGRDLHSRTKDINYLESMQFAELPVFVRQYVPHFLGLPFLKNLLSFGTLGVSWLHMTKATATLSGYNYNPVTGYAISSYYSGTQDVIAERNPNTFEWIVGAGIGYKVKNLRLFLEWRYYGAINSFSDVSTNTSANPIYKNYAYADNTVKMHKSEFGASVSYTFKNSVRKKTGRASGNASGRQPRNVNVKTNSH
jgi:hypothetical protein